MPFLDQSYHVTSLDFLCTTATGNQEDNLVLHTGTNQTKPTKNILKPKGVA